MVLDKETQLWNGPPRMPTAQGFSRRLALACHTIANCMYKALCTVQKYESVQYSWKNDQRAFHLLPTRISPHNYVMYKDD